MHQEVLLQTIKTIQFSIFYLVQQIHISRMGKNQPGGINTASTRIQEKIQKKNLENKKVKVSTELK